MVNQAIDIEYFHNPNDKDLSISSTEYSHYQFPKHFHNHYTIQFINEGINEGFTESRKYKVGPGGILIINPGELHAGNSYENKKLKFNSLRINEEFISRFCTENEVSKNGDIYFTNEPIYDKRFADVVQKAISSFKGNQSLNSETCFSELFYELISRFSNQNTDHHCKTDHPAIELAIRFIHDNYQRDLSLKDIAKSCNLSQYHFIRQFKKQCRISPFQYLRNLRVEKAKSLLSSHSISQAALEVGFFDHSHFLKNFKKIEGTLPSNFRKKS